LIGNGDNVVVYGLVGSPADVERVNSIFVVVDFEVVVLG
jgi:hypothetical protein